MQSPWAPDPSDKQSVQLFAPGLVSTDADETAIAFSFNSDTCVFVRDGKLRAMRLLNTYWSADEALLADDRFEYRSPSFGPDGTLYFSSNRPDSPDGGPADFDIFRMRPQAEGWSEPRRVAELNSSADEDSPSLDEQGSMYFTSNRPDKLENGKGDYDVFRAQFIGDRFLHPLKLGNAINTAADELHVYIAATGRAMVVERSAPSAPTSADLSLIVMRNDVWSQDVPVSDVVNTKYNEGRPTMGGPQRWIYFSSDRPTDAADTQADNNIYLVDFYTFTGAKRQ